MGSKGSIQAMAALAGLFLCGALCWHSLTHGHLATAIVGAVTAVILSGLLLRGRQRPAAPYSRSAEATFASEQSTRRLRALVDEAPSPLLLQEEDGRLIAVNRAARQMFEAAAELPVGTRRALMGHATRLDDLRGQIDWAGGRYAIQKARLDHAHLAILVDITSEVRAAEASALRDLLKVLNHELMNALTPVASMSRSALELIGDNTAESLSDARSALERVVARTEGLVGFVDSYRVLTRLPPADIRIVALGPFMDEIAVAFRAQWTPRGVALEVSAANPATTVLMDEAQIRLCLTNLLNNAAEAAVAKIDSEGGPRVMISLDSAERHVDIAIQDSGNGIEPDQSELIFLPFYTTKSTGTGVGLSLARQILQGHDSILVVRPRSPLGGAHFGFTLARPYTALNPWEAT